MANTVDENLRLFLIGDTTIAKLIGARVHENHVPQQFIGDYVWFAQGSADDEICLDDDAGSGPFRYFFDLECIARSIRHARTIANAVYARLHKYQSSTNTFGDTTVRLILVEEQEDAYVPRGVLGDSGLHVATKRVEVIP